ncbi:MAG: DUF4863 family protein [bacterium]|jgi:hypothetical protein|nr:DUF4863 family protein [Planctomycetota bacterium]HIL51179.1 DUF4863 family protein [Planctomycetota bacterium]
MLDTFQPLVDAVHGVALDDPQAACAELTRRLDPAGPAGLALADALKALLEEGKICDRGEAPVRYSRAAKASLETSQLSVDTVLMCGPGPRHRHPTGEASFAIAIDGEPLFDGQAPGWVVLPPDSVHTPTVEGGTMLIVYLLPDGKMEFL